MKWQADRASGLARLEEFVPRAGLGYARERNTDLGPENRSNVSTLSPYVRHRLVLEEQILRAVLASHSLDAAGKFVQEVFWRGYFKGWLEQRPGVWTRYRTELAALVERLDSEPDLKRRYAAAVGGRTGIGCFDSWAQELVRTGYLHNHARMWFASIWVFTLKLPWQLGADFFYRHLLDGDPASNTLSWRWVCGLHTKGKTYLARADNIARFTDGRFNPAGELATEAPALVEQPDDTRVPLTPPDDPSGVGPYVLLVTEEDCVPELIGLPEMPVAVRGLIATADRSPLEIGAPATRFARLAVGDALDRCRQHFGLAADSEPWPESPANIAEWAKNHGASTVVMAFAPVGPVAERLAALEPALEEAGIGLTQVRRTYDDATWPHATRGFFGLKKNIPRILAAAGV